MNGLSSSEGAPLPPTPPKTDWNDAKPEVVPKPSFMPAAMAFGLTLFFWGFISSPVVLVAGVVVVGFALAGWIGEMRRDG